MDMLAGPDQARFDFVDVATGKRWTIAPNEGPLPWWSLSKSRRVPQTGFSDYADLAGLAATCLPFLPGTAPSWSNHTFSATTAFVVELPAGPVASGALARHLRALRGVERGERVGSRAGCGP